MTAQCVQVKLELGHKAAIRKKPTQEGFTHDWSVFVRGPDGSNIQHFIEKVIFHLHDSFPKPKRSVKEPPYQVSESGYAGFTLPVEVCFRTKEEPKRVKFDYDLFLHLEGPPVNNVRCEKLTFRNPGEDFKDKLIKAGGVIVAKPDGTASSSQAQNVEVSQAWQPPINLTALVPSMTSSNSATSSNSHAPPVVDKSHLESQEQKVKVKSSSSASAAGAEVSKKHKSSSGKHSKHEKSHSSSKSSSQSSKSSESNKVKSPSDGAKKPSKPKDALKKKFCIAAFVKSPQNENDAPRPTSSSSQKEQSKVPKDRVASKSPASISSSGKHSSSVKKHSDDVKSEEKHHSSSKSVKKKKSSKESKDLKDVKELKETKEFKEVKELKEPKEVKELKETKEFKEAKAKEVIRAPKEERKSEHKSSTKKEKKNKSSSSESSTKVKNKDKLRESSKDRGESKQRDDKESKVKSSAKSKTTASPLPIVKNHESNGFGELVTKPKSSKLTPSPAPFATIKRSESPFLTKNDNSNDSADLSSIKPPKFKPSPIVKNHDGNSNGFDELLPALGKSLLSDSDDDDDNRASTNINDNRASVNINESASIVSSNECSSQSDLNDLQLKIMQSRERKLIQKIVDLIEETGKYKVQEKTFDFDLCSLDKETLKKLRILVNGS